MAKGRKPTPPTPPPSDKSPKIEPLPSQAEAKGLEGDLFHLSPTELDDVEELYQENLDAHYEHSMAQFAHNTTQQQAQQAVAQAQQRVQQAQLRSAETQNDLNKRLRRLLKRAEVDPDRLVAYDRDREGIRLKAGDKPPSPATAGIVTPNPIPVEEPKSEPGPELPAPTSE